MKSFALTTLLAVCLSVPALPAFAALDEATKAAAADCQKQDLDPKKGIAACTQVLDKVKMAPANTMAMHYYRGAFYLGARNADQAKADFKTAIQSYEDDPAKAGWDPSFVGLVASSYAFLGQIALEAKDCPTAKAEYGKAAATEREVSQRVQYENQSRTICK